MEAPDTLARTQEADARQLLAEVQQGAALQVHGGPDRRELTLGHLVDAGLRAMDTLREVEAEQRRSLALGSAEFSTASLACLRRAVGLHLELSRRLVSQLDQAERDGLSVRNALAFRRHYAAQLAREVMDHGEPPAQILALAQAAAQAEQAGQTQAIEAGGSSRVQSHRSWEFMKQTTALDETTQDLTARLYRRFFVHDDRHPLFAGRPLLGRLGGQQLWLVEISFELRAAALLQASESGERRYTWFWIGDASDWARPGEAGKRPGS